MAISKTFHEKQSNLKWRYLEHFMKSSQYLEGDLIRYLFSVWETLWSDSSADGFSDTLAHSPSCKAPSRSFTLPSPQISWSPSFCQSLLHKSFLEVEWKWIQSKNRSWIYPAIVTLIISHIYIECLTPTPSPPPNNHQPLKPSMAIK